MPVLQRYSEEKYRDVLSCLNARFVRYNKNEMIRKPGDDKLAGIVISGSVKLILHSESGAQISIAHYSEGEMFNEDISCAENPEDFSQIWVLSDCSVLFLDLSALFVKEKTACKFKKRVAVNLLCEIAEKTVKTNEKLRILVQKRLRDRIKVYLLTCHKNDNGVIEIPFNRNELAEYFGVDRSALSRELGRMRDEGIIKITDGGVIVKNNNFLS